MRRGGSHRDRRAQRSRPAMSRHWLPGDDSFRAPVTTLRHGPGFDDFKEERFDESKRERERAEFGCRFLRGSDVRLPGQNLKCVHCELALWWDVVKKRKKK